MPSHAGRGASATVHGSTWGPVTGAAAGSLLLKAKAAAAAQSSITGDDGDEWGYFLASACGKIAGSVWVLVLEDAGA
jgi:hypothetical protein